MIKKLMKHSVFLTLWLLFIQLWPSHTVGKNALSRVILLEYKIGHKTLIFQGGACPYVKVKLNIMRAVLIYFHIT